MFFKKSHRILAITIAITISILVMINKSGMIEKIIVSESSMMPALQMGDNLLTSKMIRPKPYDIVTFNYNDSLIKHQIFAFRIIGTFNDTIQIKNGIVYRNGKKMSKISTAHDYKVSEREYYMLKEKKQIIDDYKLRKTEEDSFYVAILDEIAKEYKLSNRRFIIPEKLVNDQILKLYQRNWNKDFFGPLIIPEGKYFVLGDNRDNAYDSRYIGLINKSQIKGTLFLQW